jgi:hypothetical protein
MNNTKQNGKLGCKTRVYALAAAGRLFHLVLMYECRRNTRKN